MPDRSKGRGQTNYSPWSSRLGVGRGANDPTPEKFAVSKPGRRPRTIQGCSAGKEVEMGEYS
jgi:hypothetical protein